MRTAVTCKQIPKASIRIKSDENWGGGSSTTNNLIRILHCSLIRQEIKCITFRRHLTIMQTVGVLTKF